MLSDTDEISDSFMGDVCTICDDLLNNQGYLHLSSCGHSFHMVCLLKNNLYNLLKCQACSKNTNLLGTKLNLIVSGHYKINMTIKVYFYRFCIYYEYFLHNKLKGYAVLIGTYDYPMENLLCERNLLKFKIRGTSHSSHVFYQDSSHGYVMSKEEVKQLPTGMRILKMKHYCNLKVKSKEIDKLEVYPIAANKKKFLIVKVLLVDGMKSEEMSGIWEMEQIADNIKNSNIHNNSYMNKY